VGIDQTGDDKPARRVEPFGILVPHSARGHEIDNGAVLDHDVAFLAARPRKREEAASGQYESHVSFPELSHAALYNRDFGDQWQPLLSARVTSASAAAASLELRTTRRSAGLAGWGGRIRTSAS
jgi:hypothetical protein